VIKAKVGLTMPILYYTVMLCYYIILYYIYYIRPILSIIIKSIIATLYKIGQIGWSTICCCRDGMWIMECGYAL